MLITVMILVILFALSVPAVFTIQRNLRQKELDSKAETIYTAVQNRLSELYSSGKSDVYNPSLHSDIKCMNVVPGDYDETESNSTLTDTSVYYIVAGSDSANSIVTSDVLDDDLRNGHWIIEIVPYAYDPESTEKNITAATVYAVYYSEDVIDVTSEYPTSTGVNDKYVNTYRDKTMRKETTSNGGSDARVGYYGGSNASSSSSTKNLAVTDIKINSNDEVETAVVKVRKPITVSEEVDYTFTLSDAYGNSHVIKYDDKSNRFVVDGKSVSNDKTLKVQHVGVNYTFTFVLDDLSSESTRFDNLYGSHSSHTSKLVSGSEIKLEVVAECKDKRVEKATDSATGNSLFAYTKKSGSALEKIDTAEVKCGRHLQNLDDSSNVTSDIKNATLISNISFDEESDFYSEYSDGYFNNQVQTTKINATGTTTSVTSPNFKSIHNDSLNKLTVTDEESNTIYNLTTSEYGLFSEVSNNLEIDGVTLVGEKINSSNTVGSFIGTINASGNVTIKNSYSYLSTSNGDIPSVITSESNLESIKFITGDIVGGLVGENDGTLVIDKSFDSSVLSGTTTGGLIGKNTGTVEISNSYSDSYLYGQDVGGLIGINENSNVTLSSVYTAGFIGLNKDENATAAGLVNGTVDKISNAYTIMAFSNIDDDGGIGEDSIGTYYSTCKSINTFKNVYYMKNGINIDGTEQKTVGKNMTFDDANFVVDTSSETNPYRLMGQSLTSYAYPRIKDLVHYGDWSVDFIAGSLVYYEEYKNDSGTYYGFDGAGVSITLTGNDTIVGDGYGIVYKDTDIPESFDVTINGVTRTIKSSDTHVSVTRSDGTYFIYPLTVDECNVENAVENYYERVTVSTEGAEDKYFDFNPHFARSVVEVASLDSGNSAIPSEISIRSPRHLNNLSKYYDLGYKTIVGNKTYRQERDMIYSSYNWTSYTNNSKTVSSQEPIGRSESTAFSATYDGGCYRIGDVSFVSESGYYIGMFGDSTGTIKNVVLATQYEENRTSYNVQRNTPAKANQTVYYGILVGKNSGTITNSAVAGYFLSEQEGTIHGYTNSTIYIGGLVGYNEGTISSSAADGPKMSLNMYRATCYAGGLIGYNTGTVSNSYALNHISSEVSNGQTIIAGFTAYNTGSISESYCATALTSSGEGSYAYAFAPTDGGGSTRESYYLYRGSYRFVDGLYSYDREDASSVGNYRTFKQLKAMRGTSVATHSEFHAITTKLDSSETTYPYRAVVKDASGNLVHYGEWQVKPELGVLGIFYWEHEEYGQNNGYKFTYIGSNNGTVSYETTLCSSHDDGGVITEYGYGYYVGEDYESDTEITDTTDLEMSDNSEVNEAAKAALEQQVPGVKFFPHTTTVTDSGDHIYLSGTNANGSITLKQGSNTYSFTISPFFANALSFNTTMTSNDKEAQEFINTTVGLETNPYEIRSADQLQYINWNSASKSTDSLVTSSNYTTYNYLMNAGSHTSSGNIVTISNAGNADRSNFVFEQSHDLNAESISNFVPIAGQGPGTSTTTGYTATLYAWFGSTYDGQSYKIQELNISSKAFSVGLFGTTAGAKIENTILYSTNGATIQRNTENTDEQGAYSLGGLIGVAYDYKEATNRPVTNCAIAGYKIIDNSKNQQGLGEANVGGLIGVANVNVEKCSAVVDIEINCTHKNSSGSFTKARWGNYIRVGGIAGAVQNEVTNCYSGGTMSVGTETLDETYNGSSYVSQTSSAKAVKNDSTNVYLSGIAGSAFTMNYQNFTGTTSSYDGKPTVTNCYTYMTFPSMKGTIRNITMFASVADRIEYVSSVITNCYYFSKSAEFDTTELPSYYFNSNSVQSCMTPSLKQSMITGSAKWMYKMFNNNSGDDRGTFTNVASKTYDELADSSMYTLLGDAFDKVTNTDTQGVEVAGKYSFPAGEKALDGKDYPFPTVIRQDNGSINVHYGTWPIKAHWSNGSADLEIFDNMASDGYAYKTFTIEKNDDDSFNLDTLKIEIVNEDGSVAPYASVEGDFTEDENGNVTVKLKALKTGSATVKATWTKDGEEYSADFLLTVKQELKVSAEPNSIELASGKSAQSELVATSSTGIVYSTSSNLTWSVSPSTLVSDEGDVGASLSGNICTITSYDLNAVITVTASYNYHGEIYSKPATITVLRPSAVGLAGEVMDEEGKKETAYNEAEVVADTSVEQTLLGTTLETAYEEYASPTNTATTFLYEINASSILENADSITYKVMDSNNEELTDVIKEDIDVSEITTNTNQFKTIPINFYYHSDDLTGNREVNVEVTITKDKTKYVLTLPNILMYPKPYMLTIDANGGTFKIDNEEKESYQIELAEEITDSSSLQLPEDRTGYVFNTWSDDAEGTIETTFPITKTGDKTIYANWKHVTVKALIDKNYETEPLQEEIILTYDETTNIEPITREGYVFSGYSIIDGTTSTMVTDKDGNILDQSTFNALIESHKDDEEASLILYANWAKQFTLKLVASDGTVFSESLVTNGDITANYVPTEQEISDGYTLLGWYNSMDDSALMVLDENGNVVADVSGITTDGKFNVSDDTREVTLYAKWLTTETKKAYVLTSTLESGKSYIIASANSGTGYAMNSTTSGNGLGATSITIQSDNNGQKYIELDSTDGLLWTKDSNKFKISNQYLYVTRSSSGWWSYTYKLQLNNSSSTNWTYSNNRLSASFGSGWSSTTGYIQYSDGSFVVSEDTSDIYFYTEGDITTEVETFTYKNTVNDESANDMETASETYENDIDTTSNDEVVNSIPSEEPILNEESSNEEYVEPTTTPEVVESSSEETSAPEIIEEPISTEEPNE